MLGSLMSPFHPTVVLGLEIMVTITVSNNSSERDGLYGLLFKVHSHQDEKIFLGGIGVLL
jgi:hypothetical protein